VELTHAYKLILTHTQKHTTKARTTTQRGQQTRSKTKGWIKSMRALGGDKRASSAHLRNKSTSKQTKRDNITVCAAPVSTTAITCCVPQVTSLISLLKSSLRIGCSFISSCVDESVVVSTSWETMLIGARGPNAPLCGPGGP
jgi:hypothetical protein